MHMHMHMHMAMAMSMSASAPAPAPTPRSIFTPTLSSRNHGRAHSDAHFRVHATDMYLQEEVAAQARAESAQEVAHLGEQQGGLQRQVHATCASASACACM